VRLVLKLILSTPENSKRIPVSRECVVSLAVSLSTDRIELEACTLNRRHVRLHEMAFLKIVPLRREMTRVHSSSG